MDASRIRQDGAPVIPDEPETWWGKPETEDEQRLVDYQQFQALYRVAGV